MPVISLRDIEKVAPGVANLSNAEHEVLQQFTLLWTLFEAQVLENNASVKKITEITLKLGVQGIEVDWFNEQLFYFKDRYIQDGATNYRFEHLRLRKNDNPELVRLVLLGEIIDIEAQLTVCLTIVYRFRNNFFHGLKWAYSLQGQFDNFMQSANLLKTCLENFPNDI